MGNQLVGIAPSQIFPVEYYLTDLPDFQYDINLGSTRFFKVARAKHKEGVTVVKVFAIHDPSLPLEAHRDVLEDIKKKLNTIPNCLPFQKSMLTEKAGILVRQYVKDNLYDRISTRPFLNSIEKRWIAFQLFHSLSQCHNLGVCHGDIKLENIMVTGWNWVMLTDFASFKPTYLPENNPADFSFFFDTSRRRTCYIAPERFVKTLNPEAVHNSTLVLPDEEIKKGDLTPAMDIFSLGCSLTELFTEGNVPFDFSQLLAYRSGEYSPWKVLEKIDDLYIRELVRHMMQKDPTHRLKAEEYLEQQRNKAFPDYFYTFLQDYFKTFASVPILTPDERIVRLKKDMRAIIKTFINEGTEQSSQEIEGLIIMVPLMTSCLRALKHCTAKLQALEILSEMAPYLSSEIILDRLLPYMLFLVNDRFPRVRVAAIQTLTHCLTLVKNVPQSDGNIFPEYILPNLSHITQDEAVIVRMAYAENIAVLAETALRFLEMTQVESEPVDNESDSVDTQTHHQTSYDTELQALQEMIQQSVTTLLSDPDNIVKQTLLGKGITSLCVFFGRQKGNDILLSHMITFLNDKEDRHLRGAFFDGIVGVAAYVGWQCCPILKPLLQQGLADSEEFVISKALHAMTDLAELGLMQKQMLYELVSETIPLLCHPNLWIRQGTVGFVCAVSRSLNLADVQCRLLPLLNPFLKQPIIQVDQEVILLNAIHDPLPRSVFDFLVKFQQLPVFLESLRERQLFRHNARSAHHPSFGEVDNTLKSAYRRLQSDGMIEEVEEKILAMKDHFLKLHESKASSLDSRSSPAKELEGIIDVSSIPIPVHHISRNTYDKQSEGKIGKKKGVSLDSPTVTMNEEWQHMFGSTDHRTPSSPKLHHNISDPLPFAGKAHVGKAVTVAGNENKEQKLLLDANKDPSNQQINEQEEKNSKPTHCLPCQEELQYLITKKLEELTRNDMLREASESANRDDKLPPHKWRPRGTLVAHLCEHSGAVNRLQVIPDTSLFATCSSDKTIKVWDCARMEGRNVANRSRHTFKLDGPVTSLTVCQNLQSLAAASDNGTIQVVRIESGSLKYSPLYSMKLDVQEEGCIVDMFHFDTGMQSILTYATVHGAMVGLDLRSQSRAWKLQNDLHLGVITTFCVDPHLCWLVIGTSNGNIICWDMRFQLPITTVSHPTASRVRRLLMHPQHHSAVFSAVNGNNEVSLWDMETQARIMTLWASSSPPLSQTQSTNQAAFSMYVSPVESGPFLLTAGSDMRIRYWDLSYPSDSYIVANAANDPLSSTVVSYKSRLIDGTEVTHEIRNKPITPQSVEDPPRRYPEVPPVGHHDCITDIGILQTSQCFLLSSSMDGVVKVWK